MTDVIARMKAVGKHFEILVDVDKALEIKKSKSGNVQEALAIGNVFTDSKKGLRAPEADLIEAFKTTDINEIARKIIIQGEIQIPAEYREKKREGKIKQVIDFLAKNAVDPRTDRPYTPERIEKSLDDAGVNITDKPIESQIKDIVSRLAMIIPIKIETKKLRITVPAQYTGQTYGLLNTYKESEEWLSNGDLKITIKIPIGLQMDFYDKLNSITHGSAISEEMKE